MLVDRGGSNGCPAGIEALMSRLQHDCAGRLALFEGRMSVDDAVKRVGIPDRGLDDPRGGRGEDIIGAFTILLGVGGMRRDRWSRQI